MEDLSHLAPPIPGLADATRIAPERKASPLAPSTSEPSSPGLPAPGIVIEDVSRPQPPETLIPVTDTLSTRPTRGGVAYPFRLKVEGDDRDVNASTLTLQSVSVETPIVEDFKSEDVSGVEEGQEKGERPGVERFVTAGVGEMSSKDGEEKSERPGVERFETAQEDLNTTTNGSKA